MSSLRRPLALAYGPQVAGIGRADGVVHCCPNCRPVGKRNDYLIDAPEAVEVISPAFPARFYAIGRDFASDTPHRWAESAMYEPTTGWTGTDAHNLTYREAREAWLRGDLVPLA